MMMHTTVVLCILGAMFSPQVNACGPFDRKLIDRVNRTLIDVTGYINSLKLDYEMELINMKIDKTNDIYEMMNNIFSPIREEIQTMKDNGRDVERCSGPMNTEYANAIISVGDEMGRCAENGFKTLTPVVKNMADFLNERKSCLLRMNLYNWFLCSAMPAWEECNSMKSHVNSTTGAPLTCDYDQYISRQEDLEYHASLFRQLGSATVFRCMQEAKDKFQSTFTRLCQRELWCVRNLS